MFEQLLALLQATGIPFAAYGWDNAPNGMYGVISLDSGAGTLAGDQKIIAQAVEGTVDLYLRDIGTEYPQTVQGVLNDMDGCAWYLNSVQYENETRLIHWEWVIQLEMM